MVSTLGRCFSGLRPPGRRGARRLWQQRRMQQQRRGCPRRGGAHRALGDAPGLTLRHLHGGARGDRLPAGAAGQGARALRWGGVQRCGAGAALCSQLHACHTSPCPSTPPLVPHHQGITLVPHHQGIAPTDSIHRFAHLQGMVTNDVRPLAAPGAGPVYAALVTPKGKLLHDIFIWREDLGAGEGAPSADPSAAPSAAAGGSGGGGGGN